MPTTRPVLDTEQYVKITSTPFVPSSLVIQSHRDTVRIVTSTVQPAKGNGVFHELGGEHAPLTIPMTETDVWALAMTERSALTVTEQRLPVEITNDDKLYGSVLPHDHTTRLFDVAVGTSIQAPAVKLAVDTVVGSRFVTMNPGHGFTVASIGNTLVLSDVAAGDFFLSEIIGVVGDVIEVNAPLDKVCPAASALVAESSTDILVDGSVTPVEFIATPLPGTVAEVTRAVLSIDSTVDQDFSTFGSAPALPIGMTIAKKNFITGDARNIITFRDNGEFINRGFEHEFFPNNGNGLRSFTARTAFGGAENFGAVIRLDGDLGEGITVTVFDDLTGGGNVKARLILQGHFV